MIRSKEGTMQGTCMVLLGLNSLIEGVQQLLFNSIEKHLNGAKLGLESVNPLKELTGHKLDNTIISDTHAAGKVIAQLRATVESGKLAKAEETYESTKKKLQEELKKLKGGKNLTPAEARQVKRMARQEARNAMAKKTLGERIREWRPEKPAPETSVRPKLKVLTEEELEKVAGGAKDPNWRPQGTGGGAVEKDAAQAAKKAGEGAGGLNKSFLTPQQLNQFESLVLEGQDVVFKSKEQAIDFIRRKFPSFNEEVAGLRSKEGWHFDIHPIGNSEKSIEHINLYSKKMGFRVHITWEE